MRSKDYQQTVKDNMLLGKFPSHQHLLCMGTKPGSHISSARGFLLPRTPLAFSYCAEEHHHRGTAQQRKNCYTAHSPQVTVQKEHQSHFNTFF